MTSLSAIRVSNPSCARSSRDTSNTTLVAIKLGGASPPPALYDWLRGDPYSSSASKYAGGAALPRAIVFLVF